MQRKPFTSTALPKAPDNEPKQKRSNWSPLRTMAKVLGILAIVYALSKNLAPALVQADIPTIALSTGTTLVVYGAWRRFV